MDSSSTFFYRNGLNLNTRLGQVNNDIYINTTKVLTELKNKKNIRFPEQYNV